MATVLAEPLKQSSIAPQKFAIAYVRVSTDMQTVENQHLQIAEFATKHGYTVLDWYADEGISGTVPAIERAGFGALLDFVRNNPSIDAILVYEVSRLGRTFYDTIDVIRTIEQKLGIPIIACSPKEWFLQNPDKMARQMTLSMYAIFAERERDLISERTKQGLARVAATGRHIGRPPRTIDMIQLAKLLRDDVPRCTIAKRLGVSKGTLYKKLAELGEVRTTYRPGIPA